MSVRVHTTNAWDVTVCVVAHETLNEMFGGIYDHDDIEQALVIDDGGNQEAMVLVGNDAELLGLTDAIRFQIINPWDEDGMYPVSEWQYEVANNDTHNGYSDWVRARRDSQHESRS